MVVSSFSPPPKAEKPTLAHLMKMKSANGEKIQNIKQIAPQWKQLGALLNFDPEGWKVDLIEAEHKLDGPVSCCQATIFFFLTSLTTVPSENQCLSSGAYEWPVLVSLKHAVGLSQHWFLLQEWFRESLSKLMACSPTCELHSPHLGCGLELILASTEKFMPTALF